MVRWLDGLDGLDGQLDGLDGAVWVELAALPPLGSIWAIFGLDGGRVLS